MPDASDVHLLFLDESGKPDEKTFAVGGMCVEAGEWDVLRQRWQAALSAHSWPDDREVKWHGTRTGEVPPALADDVFAALAGAPIWCYVVLLRALAGKSSHPGFFSDDDETYATALMFLAERFQRFLSREDSHGVIVLDSRRPEADERLRRFMERLKREGTPYVTLDRIVDSLMLGPSHHSIGLQAADLVVASTLAARRNQGDASRWHRQLLPRFARHPDTGALHGVGLVEFPARSKGEPRGPAKLFGG